jgi:hypothetical protein
MANTTKSAMYLENISAQQQEALTSERVTIDALSLHECRALLLHTAEEKPLLFYNTLIDLADLLLLRDLPRTQIALSLKEAHQQISEILNETHGLFGYITGGLEGLYLQQLLHGYKLMGINGFFIGLEYPDYTSEKGRYPLFTMSEKINLWKVLAPNNSIVFPIPKRPTDIPPDTYYDYIASYLGCYKNDKIIMIGAPDDPSEIREAHRRRARTSNHCLSLGITFSTKQMPIHVTNLLDPKNNIWEQSREAMK